MRSSNPTQPKKSLKVLNSKEKKPILKFINEQWGDCFDHKEFVFLLNNKAKLYISNADIGQIDLDKLRIDHVGMYFGTVEDDGIRLSIEGSQLVGPRAEKTNNIIELNDEEAAAWIRGEDIEKPEYTESCDSKYVLIKNKDDFLGCTRQANGIIRNFVPKARRVSVS